MADFPGWTRRTKSFRRSSREERIEPAWASAWPSAGGAPKSTAGGYTLATSLERDARLSWTCRGRHEYGYLVNSKVCKTSIPGSNPPFDCAQGVVSLSNHGRRLQFLLVHF